MYHEPIADEFEHEGVPVKLVYDTDAGNPYSERDCASMLLIGEKLSRDYSLGETLSLTQFNSCEHAARWLTLFGGYALAIPFRVDDGSNGLRTYLVDTGSDMAAGFLVMTREKLAEEFKSLEQAEACARSEFSEFKCYVEGDVYGYVVADGREDEDSCWGFYGFEWAKEAATEAAGYTATERARVRALPWLPTFGNPITSPV